MTEEIEDVSLDGPLSAAHESKYMRNIRAEDPSLDSIVQQRNGERLSCWCCKAHLDRFINEANEIASEPRSSLTPHPRPRRYNAAGCP